jgi:hypothetical protein
VGSSTAERAVRCGGGGAAVSPASGCAGGGGGDLSRVRVRIFRVAAAASSGDTTGYRSLGSGAPQPWCCGH